ncbi:MAG: CDGSH iron-sulfur domain-containing protein [Anaerolineales bacterium]|nr:CDGSH iron-sulfur domain-containing protein [Anaerolineales bacterium]
MSENLEIKAAKNGPYLIPGNFTFTDAEGVTKSVEKMVALCRCGHSANKPFCDGTHKKIGFEAPESLLTLRVVEIETA